MHTRTCKKQEKVFRTSARLGESACFVLYLAVQNSSGKPIALQSNEIHRFLYNNWLLQRNAATRPQYTS